MAKSSYTYLDDQGQKQVTYDVAEPLNRLFQKDPEAVSSVMQKILSRTPNRKKGEARSVTGQQTNSQGLTKRYIRAMDPNEFVKGRVLADELMPPGLRKQKALVNTMEGGLAGLLESFKNSPASIMNLQGVGAGIDQLFGTKTKEILQPTTSNLALKIPKLAEMVAKERSKYSAQEQQLLSKVLSDFDTEQTKTSASDVANFKDGIQDASRQAGLRSPTENQDRNYKLTVAQKATDFVNQNVDSTLNGTIRSLNYYLNEKYPKGSPLSRAGIIDKYKTGKFLVKEWANMSPEQKEVEFQADRERMNTLYETLKASIMPFMNKGATSDSDIKRAEIALGRDWVGGSDANRRAILKEMQLLINEKYNKLYDVQADDVKKHMKEGGTNRNYFLNKNGDYKQQKKIKIPPFLPPLPPPPPAKPDGKVKRY